MTPTPLPAPAWAEIAAQNEALTEAQWRAYLTSIKGRRYTALRGTVDDVTPHLGDPTLQLDTPGGTGSYQYSVPIPRADGEKYSKGQTVLVTGDIDNVNCFLWCVIFLRNTSVAAP